jgi:membrane protein
VPSPPDNTGGSRRQPREAKLSEPLSVLNLNQPAPGLGHPSGLHPRRRKRVFLHSLQYLFTTEVHVYASSIAANALLAFFPFMLLMLTICLRWLHWQAAYTVVLEWLRANLPAGANFVVRNLVVLALGHRRLQIISAMMLLFTGSGIFMPVEIALNRAWGFPKNRSFLRNQLISLGLALACGVLAFLSIMGTALLQSALRVKYHILPSHGLLGMSYQVILQIITLPCIISILFLVYYFLPNGPVPAGHALATAIIISVLCLAGRFVYTLCLPFLRFREVYGPFALSATLLIWAFAGALALLWGARISAQISFDVLEN